MTPLTIVGVKYEKAAGFYKMGGSLRKDDRFPEMI
jgi:hypothetical protein